MSMLSGQEIARQNELKVLKYLHKFSWLRTRDLAALVWMRSRSRKLSEFEIVPLEITNSALRMAQITLLRMRDQHLVLWTKAPDGSTIFGLAEAGVRLLSSFGIPAKSGKDAVRRVSLSFYHHRRIANEVAILAMLQGFRVATEAEISAGNWLGGMNGIYGKKPDVLIRDGKNAVWVEVERSRRNHKDHQRLLDFLHDIWPSNGPDSANLPSGQTLQKLLFVNNAAFVERLAKDLKDAGWTDEQIFLCISCKPCLYVTEAKFLIRKSKPNPGMVALSN